MNFDRLFAHAGHCTTAFTKCCRDLGWPERPARLLSHIVLAEAVWLSRIRSTTPPNDLFALYAPDEILRTTLDHHTAFVHELRERPDAVITYRRRDIEGVTSTVSEIATHVITHGFHHRGQIAAWGAEHGHAMPNADLITFFRDHPSV
jgi:uncharacterized damage-inducible protein DinB